MPFKDPLKRKEYHKKWRDNNKTYIQRYAQEHRDDINRNLRNWKNRHREKYLLYRRAYDKIYYEKHKRALRHKDSCIICGIYTKMYYDHDHKTGKFRGWICRHCNTALGFVKDNINILQSMIKYLGG